VGIEADRVGFDNARAHCADFKAPAAKEAGRIIEDEDTNETVEQIVAWLDERKLLA
jgi:electron transfer flavoprotein beta subunit